jgi:hypothetical protein
LSTRWASCLANNAPTTSPKPQFIQLAVSATIDTSSIAWPGVFAKPAAEERSRRTAGVVASMKPVTTISAICMEKASRVQIEFPQYVATATGLAPIVTTERTATMNVRMNAKISGSGIQRSTIRTESSTISSNGVRRFDLRMAPSAGANLSVFIVMIRFLQCCS